MPRPSKQLAQSTSNTSSPPPARKKKWVLISILALGTIGAISMIWYGALIEIHRNQNQIQPLGTAIDEFNGVVVYSNGHDTYTSHGRHFSDDGYYYGHRWQCVEFVKRYYYDHFGHRMPDGWGHARSFFDPSVAHGTLNPTRGLIQYSNGKQTRPASGDLLVFVYGQYGHVAIISQVKKDRIEIVQQNVGAKTRENLPLEQSGKRWMIHHPTVAGWLRLPPRATPSSPKS
ncbi:CHAP domain-containing protein [Verrucomicrobiaceae bacterium N1E253]|uniref:CHAP domain-containing protein n=1 Tax=Oceaniferula marina TaxID=2748318 RepID=A0A851G8J2_9BACT|nr:CHAP domain-containing protein [Oceaniferula marina]NWK54028.1 CHAP domain-containing protein [Oceaniferula marina]